MLIRATVLGLVLSIVPASHPEHAVLRPLADGSPIAAPPRQAGEWDRVLQNVELTGDVVVPAGESWLIGANVRIEGNLRTDSGTIAMRPGSSLTFVGVEPERYVGGGMRFEPEFARDYGIWVGGVGVLDIRGTPKQGWNRTGTHATWRPGDELWIAPTAAGDHTPRRWRPGDPIPRVDERVPPAEVVNVTRDVRIQGGHIHISSSKPQRIEYVTLRGMGVLKREMRATTGRYALHFHFMGNGARGTMVRGVAAIDSRSRVFVPHESHGITFEDNVSVNSAADAFWWDGGDRSNDILVDRLAVLGVFTPREAIGETPRFKGVVLNGGTNLAIRNSAVSGVRGSSTSHAFDWPSSGDNTGPAVWSFGEGNVAHNNEGAGIRLWFNDEDPHVMRGYVTYRNEGRGVENGAYGNAHRYLDGLSLDGMVWHSGARRGSADGLPAGAKGVHVESSGVPLVFGRFNKGFSVPLLFEDCELVNREGGPRVVVGDRNMANRFDIVFRHCGLTPDDVAITAFPPAITGSRIRIEHEDGRVWEIRPDMASRRQIVTEMN